MTDEFNWGSDDDVVIPHVAATAVYQNQDGDVVIRQQRLMDTEDSFVFVPLSFVDQLISAIKRATKS